MLRAANCNVSHRDHSKKCADSGSDSSGGGKDDKDSKKTKMLIALAAVLGISGIVWYDLTSI